MAETHEETIQKQTENEPKNLLSRITSVVLVPVFTGVIGLGVGLGTNYFQARENMRAWEIQHDAEIKTTLLSKRIEVLNALQENVTRYFEFDVETGIEHNYQVFKVAMKSVIPKYKFNSVSNIPSFPSADHMKEDKDIWSNLTKLAESIDVYFGDKIGKEAAPL